MRVAVRTKPTSRVLRAETYDEIGRPRMRLTRPPEAATHAPCGAGSQAYRGRGTPSSPPQTRDLAGWRKLGPLAFGVRRRLLRSWSHSFWVIANLRFSGYGRVGS